jgi:MFS family permease
MRRRLRLAADDTFRSLQVRNFRLFFTGQVISQVGNWLTLIAQALLVLKLTHSGVAVGLLTACQFGPVLLLGAWAGLVADRSDKRRLLLIEQTVAMAQSFVLATIAFLPHPPIGAIYAVAVVGGLTTAFDNPARRAFVIELVEQDDVQNAVALNSAIMTGSRVIGPALAGLLIATSGFGWCFLLDGLTFIAVLVALWRIDPTEVHPSPVAERGRGQVRAGLRYVRDVPVLRISLVMMAIVGTLTYNFSVVLPLFVTESLGGETWQFTILFSVLSAGSVVGALWAARRSGVDLRHVARALGAFGLSMCVLAAAPNLGLAFPAAIAVGLSSIVFMTAVTSIVQLRADPVMRGRVLALQAIVFLGSTPIGGPVLGAICDATNARVGVLVGGAAALAAGGWGWTQARQQHDVPLEGPIAVDVPIEVA